MLSMSFYDWNHDGKKDFVDDYLEYNIYKESTENNSSGSGFFGKLFIGFVVFYIFIYFFGTFFESEKTCMAISCMEERSGSSIYCTEHRWEYE